MYLISKVYKDIIYLIQNLGDGDNIAKKLDAIVFLEYMNLLQQGRQLFGAIHTKKVSYESIQEGSKFIYFEKITFIKKLKINYVFNKNSYKNSYINRRHKSDDK